MRAPVRGVEARSETPDAAPPGRSPGSGRVEIRAAAAHAAEAGPHPALKAIARLLARQAAAEASIQMPGAGDPLALAEEPDDQA
jgi:hypothetical protein